MNLAIQDTKPLPVFIEADTIRMGRHTKISFHRTLRIPEDGKSYPLPADLGRLPIYRVSDYAHKVPAKWLKDGGFFIPLYQREALFIEFGGVKWRPSIAKVAVGMINAISGKSFVSQIQMHSQDYVVVPEQKWLDGINSGKETVSQFVAMPLGEGYTVEELITDEAVHGGFQLAGYDPRPGRFPEEDPAIVARRKIAFDGRHEEKEISTTLASAPVFGHQAQFSPRVDMGALFSNRPSNYEMGIAAGGSIQQQIVKDGFGADSWDECSETPVFIHIVNSVAFEAITGMKPPPTPITAYSYKKRGIPWYSRYDEKTPGLSAAKAFQFIKTVLQIDKARNEHSANEVPAIVIQPEQIRRIHVPTIRERIDALKHAAHSSFNSERYESAIREATCILDLSPNDPYGLLMRANCYIALKQFELADIDASTAIECRPDNVDAYLLRALANICSGFFPLAAADARAALRFSPTSVIAKELLNQALGSQKQ